MEVDDALTPVLPKGLLIDAVSRLSAKDACRLKVLSKSWLSLVSYNSEFKRLHRLRARQRPPLLLFVQAIRHSSSAGLFCEPCSGDMGHTLVFKFRSSSENLGESVASCRDLMLFHDSKVIYVYSPSTHQYLRFETQPKPIQYRVGLVYIASMNLYKIVKLEVHGSPAATVRFEALTVQEEDDEPQVDENHQACSSWEFIIKHAMHHSRMSINNLGNLIGVTGVVYAVLNISDVEQGQVVSLGFEEQDHKQYSFKIFDLPQVACHGCTMHNKLYQVKDHLCFPHTTTSSIDLWLLKDRNTCTWFKGHTISYIPQPHHKIWNLFYCPQPTTAFLDDADNGAGLYLFRFGDRLFVYDMHSKEFRNRCVEKYQHGEECHVFTDSLYSLKNGLRCTRGPFDVVPRMWLMDNSLNNQLIPPDVSDNEDPKASMELDDVLRSRLPMVLLIDVASRLSAKDACKLKTLSKSWHHLFRAPQMPPLLVLAKYTGDESRPRLFIEEEKDFGVRKVVFNFYFTMECMPLKKISSCRDLMCFHDNKNAICVYSPSTNQYLRFKAWVGHGLPEYSRLGLVYVASMNLYKIVKLEMDCSNCLTLRFAALTVVQDEEYGPQFRGGRGDEQHSCSWELISEHFMHSTTVVILGNLIGVNGVAYTLISIKGIPHLQVLSLGFEEQQHYSFKMLSIPQAACDEGDCRGCGVPNSLFQVKDLLCFPHHMTSSVDLWLLEDRNTSSWFKGYSISYIPRPWCYLQSLAYSPPHPATTAAGVILFVTGGKVFQYDISTKEVKYLSQDKSILGLHVFSNMYPLKNGLSCPHMPAAKIDPPETNLKTMVPPPRRGPPPRRVLPPPSPYIQALKHKRRVPLLMVRQDENLPQPPPPPQCLISLPPPPPPPPPKRFNPLDFKHGIDLPEAKKRKSDSSASDGFPWNQGKFSPEMILPPVQEI